MRVAAILGLGLSAAHLQPFARCSDAEWQLGMPANPTEADAILVFGGDGTVHRHLPQLVELRLPVLIVPHGSGNDFARGLHLRSVGDALSAWRRFVSGHGSVRQVDLGVIAPVVPPDAGGAPPPLETGMERYFCCVGGVGLDVEIARRANRLPRALRRRGGYLLSLLPALSAFRPVGVTVQASLGEGALSTRYAGPAMVVSFANTPTYGGGIRIAPDASLDDGKLQVCVVEAMAKVRLLRLFPSAFAGRHLNLPEVRYFQAERLRVETEPPSEVYADGEYVCSTPVQVRISAGALRVILP
ncbi:MAG: diacylglycerol/lipid kinase family protein [Terriglobales bacterium]